MFPLGHIGIVLILFSPLGYVLLVRNRRSALAPGLAVALALTLVPDFDLFLPMFVHRGMTHTLLATVCIGVFASVLWVVCRFSGPWGPGGGAAYGFLVGVLSGGGHLLGDVITPMGIQPFLPWNPTVYTLSLTYARDPVANFTLFAIGVVLFSTGVNLAALSTDSPEELADESAVDSTVSSD